jgi:hypothetical protein
LCEADGYSCGALLLFDKVHLLDIVGPTKNNVELSLNSVGGMHVVVTDQSVRRNKLGSWTNDDVNPRSDV